MISFNIHYKYESHEYAVIFDMLNFKPNVERTHRLFIGGRGDWNKDDKQIDIET